MLEEVLRAFALVLVIEGLLPFLSPRKLRQSLLAVAGMEDRSIRLIGLGCVIGGVLLLQLLSSAG